CPVLTPCTSPRPSTRPRSTVPGAVFEATPAVCASVMEPLLADPPDTGPAAPTEPALACPAEPRPRVPGPPTAPGPMPSRPSETLTIELLTSPPLMMVRLLPAVMVARPSSGYTSRVTWPKSRVPVISRGSYWQSRSLLQRWYSNQY